VERSDAKRMRTLFRFRFRSLCLHLANADSLIHSVDSTMTSRRRDDDGINDSTMTRPFSLRTASDETVRSKNEIQYTEIAVLVMPPGSSRISKPECLLGMPSTLNGGSPNQCFASTHTQAEATVVIMGVQTHISSRSVLFLQEDSS
jgi:hypothetical protein